MLEHLSSKFRTPPQASLLEPRAALILNRFTRTLTVMYATDAVQSILGVTADQFKDKSFYECMQENCLAEAIRCLESAKANDSIAYLRFWYRDPRREDLEQELHDASQSSDSEDGGVELNATMDLDDKPAVPSTSTTQDKDSGDHPATHNSRTSSGESTDLEQDSAKAMFDHTQRPASSTSSLAVLSPEVCRRRVRHRSPQPAAEPFEIEAVVSCTSDGLVVVLRRARPLIPDLQPPPQMPQYANGLFAAPWGAHPIRPHIYQPDRQFPFQHGLQAPQLPAGGPPQDEFMNSIREVAVFAWSLVGINGNIASYGHGIPHGEAQPPNGLPIWDPYGQPTPDYAPPENQAVQRWSRLGQKTNEPSTVPYQYPREGALLQHQNGFGFGPMQSDHPISMAQAPQGHQLAFSYQPQVQAEILNLDHAPHGSVQDGWAPGNESNQNQNQQGPSEGFGGNRYLWY